MESPISPFCRKNYLVSSCDNMTANIQATFGKIMINFKGRHFQQEMILQSIRWYLGYSLSYRDIEEIMKERGFEVDHSTIQRWVVHYSPNLEKAFHPKKKRPGSRWRLDETYIKVKLKSWP